MSGTKPGVVKLMDAGHRERQVALHLWRAGKLDNRRPFWMTLEKVGYDALTDSIYEETDDGVATFVVAEHVPPDADWTKVK